jgi:phospholipase C
MRRASLITIIALLGLPSCSGHTLGATPPAPSVGAAAHAKQRSSPRHLNTTPIQHVVIVIQENRSMNDMFNGYPGALTVTTGLIHTGKRVKLRSEGLETPAGSNHTLADFLAACDGSPSGQGCKMDGFDLESGGKKKAYDYVPQAEVQPLFDIASQNVLDDEMFQSHVDGSFVAHQYLIAAQAESAVNYPSAQWGCGGPPGEVVSTITQQRTIGPTESPCFDYQTLGDELDNAGLSWRFYAPQIGKPGDLWSAYRAISHIYNGPDWKNDVINPETQFLTDVTNPTNPYLADVTWITPDYKNSDHPGSKSATGPQWVASVVNAVGASTFWSSTVVFVLWDDWGGFYDPVAPQYLDYDGLGFRVPMLCASPYAIAGTVNHTPLEFGSILRFVENNWSLPQLAASDARATPADTGCLNYSQKARPFKHIHTQLPPSYFIHERPSLVPPDTD